MKKRYTSEEIWYNDAGIVSLDNDKVRSLIARLLSKVPKDVADKVLEECLFIMPMFDEIGFHLPKNILQNKCVIAFSESLLKEDDKNIVHIGLHEIAHFYLDHKSPLLEDLSDEEAKKQEEDADRLADKWLREFDIDSKQKPK